MPLDLPVCCAKYMTVRLLCLRTVHTAGNILFRLMPNGNCLFSSASLSLLGNNSLVHKVRVMAAVDLHLNATYAQHLALKSIYEKSKYVMGGKLFSFIGQCLN